MYICECYIFYQKENPTLNAQGVPVHMRGRLELLGEGVVATSSTSSFLRRFWRCSQPPLLTFFSIFMEQKFGLFYLVLEVG